jgi:hypothetical protein
MKRNKCLFDDINRILDNFSNILDFFLYLTVYEISGKQQLSTYLHCCTKLLTKELKPIFLLVLEAN